MFSIRNLESQVDQQRTKDLIEAEREAVVGGDAFDGGALGGALEDAVRVEAERVEPIAASARVRHAPRLVVDGRSARVPKVVNWARERIAEQ